MPGQEEGEREEEEKEASRTAQGQIKDDIPDTHFNYSISLSSDLGPVVRAAQISGSSHLWALLRVEKS